MNLRDQWAAGSNTPERQDVEAVVHPVATTDAAGVARFDALLPGRYTVIAAVGDGQRVRSLRESWHGHSAEPFAVAAGVPVGVGRTTAHRMTVYPQPDEARVRVFRPDGQPLTGEHIAYDYGSIGGGGWSSSRPLTADGSARLAFESAGLWRVSFKYRDSPITSYPLHTEPYDAAEGVLAASALLPADAVEPARLTARRFDPGSVVAELKDAAGRPARGFVEMTQGNDADFAGATDEAGVVRFDGVPTWKYVVRASLAGRPPIDLGEYEGPVPDERALTGVTAVLGEAVAAEPNTERRVVLREQPVGYVRGTLRPPAGQDSKNFGVYLTDDAARHGARVHYRPSTGECAAGPFPPGGVRLRTGLVVIGAGAGAGADVRDVTVAAGKVTRVELAPPAEQPRPLAGPGGLSIDVHGISYQMTGAEHLAGRVLRPGGTEPALAATVMYFGPSGGQPLLGGLTDARGQVRGRGLRFWAGQPAGPPDDPPGPVVVALLPGSHGATVVPPPEPGKPLEVVLPPAVTVRGRVTVGGQSRAGPPATVRVFAAYEGRGKGRLGGVLSVQTTAQEDGSFELAGLTPGRYTIQAALDNIWLSPSAAVDAAGPLPDTLVLAIPEPGGPVAATVVGPDGKPLPGRQVTIDRPAGPLAAILWPAGWTTDGAGVAFIPALEAGRHTLRVGGTAAAAEVVVPALPAERAVEVRVPVGADGGRK